VNAAEIAAEIAAALESARDGDVAAAGFRLAWHQLREDEREGRPSGERRRRFDAMVEATRQLQK
jgi:hypothetical protein